MSAPICPECGWGYGGGPDTCQTCARWPLLLPDEAPEPGVTLTPPEADALRWLLDYASVPSRTLSDDQRAALASLRGKL